MKKLFASLAVATALAVPGIAAACEGHEGKVTMAKAAVKKVTVQELAQLNQSKQAVVLDVNDADVRAQYGTIPNARLLTDYAKYDLAKELPAQKDSKLVFYCASTQCSASHKAAKRAVEAGYTDVNILPDGIKGWKAAGQPVTQVNRS